MKLSPDDFVKATKSLADRVAQIPGIARHTTARHNEPAALAHALVSLAEVCEDYLKDIPAVLDAELSGEALMEKMGELMGDVQGLLYALESSKYLREMFDPLRKEWRQ